MASIDKIKDEHAVNFATPRGFLTKLKTGVKETFFPDDPCRQFNREEKPLHKAFKGVQYFMPIFEWLPTYTWRLFISDFLAGLTITSLAVPQGISYAKLADLPPIIGLYSSFVPPIVYAIFGSSRQLAVGTFASGSLLIYQSMSTVIKPEDDPILYLHLVFAVTFVAGAFQACLGLLRLGILVDFVSNSTITGFVAGAAVMLCLQQLKGIFGLKHFVTKTDLITVVKGIWTNSHEVNHYMLQSINMTEGTDFGVPRPSLLVDGPRLVDASHLANDAPSLTDTDAPSTPRLTEVHVPHHVLRLTEVDALGLAEVDAPGLTKVHAPHHAPSLTETSAPHTPDADANL
ncbi:hypothetical protein TanjilG_32772 [Lupinus angustifolius]|uniref:SLC26A/SulP transporter domain-containing protein n=1 Tax=Lupinus angustifolius TaxID=3871 RepID=A0A4P1RFF3_LUPAN|nr:PREDICTED: probable sulfate transporter 3.5 [Lupinus angustifolius]OIW10032.1 hypothetical protein TanjilG_32772 [Lupinus angustifolius]